MRKVVLGLLVLAVVGCGERVAHPAAPDSGTVKIAPAVPAPDTVMTPEPTMPKPEDGDPATREQCDALFAKSAEIELRGQNITDPKTIAERTAAARATPMGSKFTSQCVGKRITKRALECVQRATTAEQFDHCL